jgi:hypothetical protein
MLPDLSQKEKQQAVRNVPPAVAISSLTGHPMLGAATY